MEQKTFTFSACICGDHKQLSFSAPIKNGHVITNKYCPESLLSGDSPAIFRGLITSINGEEEKEFIQDCKTQISSMEDSEEEDSKLEVHMAALSDAVMLHVLRCRRLIFGDLLIYVDCFSYLLEADGFSEQVIRRMYPRMTKAIVDAYPQYVKNSANLAPLHNTIFYQILTDLVSE